MQEVLNRILSMSKDEIVAQHKSSPEFAELCRTICKGNDSQSLHTMNHIVDSLWNQLGQ